MEESFKKKVETMTNDVFQCMRDSHSVRHFQPDMIPDEMVTKILEAGSWAPSAGNLQPWYFYVVKDQAVKSRVYEACFDQSQIEQAPVLIVILADPARSNEHYAERGAQLYCLQDTAAAAQNMLLAAEALGIGACWVGSFDEVAVQQVVKAAPRLRAVIILALGYSNEQQPEIKNRLRVAEVAKFIQ